MPSPSPDISVQVYLPRTAFEQISASGMQVAAKRIGYDGPLRWETSVHDLPPTVPAESVRLTCMVGEAFVFLECFCDLVDTASAREDDELLMTYADALTALYDGIEQALRDYQ
jgi:hypothetical protein